MAALLVVGAPAIMAETHYVSPAGSAAPEADQVARPWQSIQAAVWAFPFPPPPQAGTVSIAAGIYRDAFTIDTPTVLKASSAPVVIGDWSGVTATTTFSVFTWNTHLFGDVTRIPILGSILPYWQDYERADEMGAYLGGRRNEIDLVSLCEVWDEDLFVGGGGAYGIRPRSGYPNSLIFNDINPAFTSCGLVPEPRAMHSGLAMMTKHPMSDVQRVYYNDCSGSCVVTRPDEPQASPDCLSSKGFLATTVVKDGFEIRVYDTHTQSDDYPDALAAREAQIRQLTDSIAGYRAAHPGHVVIVMGDMNVIGETAEQYDYVWGRFQAFGGRDAARNTASISMYANHRVADTFTAPENALAHYFYPNSSEHKRLDYVWYFPSLDGHVRIQPIYVNSPRVHGAFLHSEGGLTSNELSDHYPVEARFRLDRLQ